MRRGSHRIWNIAWIVVLLGAPLAAHETDQFTTPIGREFADLGPFFNQWAYDLLDEGVRKTNSEIRRAIEQGNDPSSAQIPERLITNIHDSLPWSVHQIENFEWLFLSGAMRQRYPGRLVSYREIDHNIYEHAFSPLDYRVFSRWFFASTIKVYGTYLGTDKLGHFTDEGIAYYWAWHEARNHGANEAQALAAAVRIGTEGPGSEDGWLGMLANGDYANGDLSANYLGFLFYRNIAEATFIKGAWQPPLAVLDGSFWRLNDHVRRDSDFFALFISDQLDEALNPGFFDESMRPALHQAVKARASAIRWRYRDAQGLPRPRAWFEQKLDELSTMWGADYGHRGLPAQLVSIANSCFDEPSPIVTAAAHVQNPVDLASADEAESSATLADCRFAQEFQTTESSQRLVQTGRLDGLADEFGRTPLHDAAAAGAVDAVAALLAGGVDPNERDTYGTTPLHLACRNGHPAIVQLLLNAGALANAVNQAGATPLHDAALAGDSGCARLLLEHGGDQARRDQRGLSAADIAAARHNDRVAALLK